MLFFITKRIFWGVITVWFIATATFLAMHMIPGNPLTSERAVSPEIRLQLEQRYGLDKPLYEQYGIWLGNMMRGDFGLSFVEKNRSVNSIIAEHFKVSATLGLLALFLALVGGVLLGAMTARYKGRWPDGVIMILVIIGVSVPSFVFAALAQLFILHLKSHWNIHWFPVAGWGGISYMLVPSLVLGLSTMAYLSRLLRSSMLEVRDQAYIRTAVAKGVPPLAIFFRHQFRNAILPVLAILGPAVAAITTGGFVVEQVFAIPGLARYFIQAVQQLDYTVIMGTTVFYGVFLVTVVVFVDLLYGLIDPRIRLGADHEQ